MKPNDADHVPLSRESLTEWFETATRPNDADHLVGTELETFGVTLAGDAPAPINFEDHIQPVMREFVTQYGWRPGQDRGTGGEIVSLERDRASISLEPGGQFELSGKPLPHVHATCEEFTRHYNELHAVSLPRDLAWLATGFHPFARLEDINRMPKGRYAVMRAYLPRRGARGLDMMHRTCTVQANFDYASERQCGERLRVAMGVSALSTALFANSPFYEGSSRGRVSERSTVWSSVDPSRCGLLPFLLEDPASFSFERYVDWALEIPMFFVKRDGQYFAHHATFAEYMRDGFEDPHGARHHATQADWRLHLNTLFPEVRLNPYIEVRGADAVGSRFVCSLPALWKGLLYDDDALAAAWDLVAELEFAARLALWDECRARGMSSPRVQSLCLRLLAIARASLERQDVRDSRGRTEARFLTPLETLAEEGRSPADAARANVEEADARGQDHVKSLIREFHFAGAGPRKYAAEERGRLD